MFKIGDIVKVIRKHTWNSHVGDICRIVNIYNDCKQDMSSCKKVYLCVCLNDSRNNEMEFYEDDIKLIKE